MSDHEALFDVVAVNIKTGAERVIASGKTEQNAEAIVKIAVMRRGVEEEFFKTVLVAKGADMTLDIDALEALLAKATPGPWRADPKRLIMNGQQGPIMSYLAGSGAEPEGMKVSLASERVADHKLVAALRNAAPALLKAARQEEKMRAALVAAKMTHYTCEDPWYSCPKSPDGCIDDGQGSECNCGADSHNAAIDRALEGES